MASLNLETTLNLAKSVVADPSQVGALLRRAGAAYVAHVRREFDESPFHVLFETVLIVFILYILVFKRSYDPTKRGFGERAPKGLTKKEKDELIREWAPEPLVPRVAEADRATQGPERVVRRLQGVHLELEGGTGPLLNFASWDFLGLCASPAVERAARETMAECGLGSCGPRGFYGTFDKHLELETELARFMGVDEAITYSDLNSTASSAVPAFAKRGDLIVVDEGCNDAIFTGVQLSRARVVTFKHNDMTALKEALKAVAAADRRAGRDGSHQRRFIVTEGLFRNHGDTAPLQAIVRLKKEFRFRLILDESYSFGVLGRTGRGLTEEASVPVTEVDVLTGSLNSTLASVGGFCVGERSVVDHQRLNGAGYCYSASAPPFTAAASTAALREMIRSPALLSTLRSRSRAAREALAEVRHLRLLPEAALDTPLLFLSLRPDGALACDEEAEAQRRLQAVCDAAATHGVALTTSKHIMDASRPAPPVPSIRIVVTAAHTPEHVATLTAALERAVDAVVASL